MECPICYECVASPDSSRTPCGHVFHRACMASWLERATTCPSCRTVVADAPTLPVADPFDELDERYRLLCELIAATKVRLEAVSDGLKAFAEDQRKARRSAAAKRGAATRAANRAARAMSCN